MPLEQLALPLGALRNRALFSSHWLENRLPLEPEWTELHNEAREVLDLLSELWRAEKGRVEKYGDEQGLEQAFIQPVLKSLGWELKYQTFLQGRKPDYALFLDNASLDAALAVDRTSPDYWKYPTLVADAKAWHVSLDRPTTVNNKREYPPEQIESYLNLSRLDFGIITNGKLWRLVPREYNLQQRRFQTYLELDLQQLLESWSSSPTLGEQFALFDEFFRFYLFFSPAAFLEVDGRKTLLQRAVEGSSEYRLGVGEGLKDRAFEALRLCIEGLLARQENELDPSRDLELCREQSFILLYRLLFVMYAEDRRLLPYKLNRTYTNNRSLGRRRDEVAGTLDRSLEGRGADYAHDSTALWSDLLDLFDLVDRGHRTYGVPAYNGGLFDAEAHAFLAEKQISDYYMARIIDQLGRASDPHKPVAGLFRVDYYDLAIQHLGGIYEGLLELHPHYATEQMIVVKKRGQGKTEERVQSASKIVSREFQATGTVYAPRSVYLLTNKGERRASGSYYTPDHIVEYIVERTLYPLCSGISQQLQSEIDAAQSQLDAVANEERAEFEVQVEKLRRDFDDRVLSLRVLDPAMGSGHFLIRACQYLAEEIATHPYTGDDALTNAASDESALAYWKRRVVERCLYGVDMNEMAVELAKLALWLETVAADQPLSFLDHHLRHGNSLVGARLSTLGVLPGEIVLLENNFARQAEAQLPVLLEPLAAIRNAPSETAAQVKEKQRLHVKFERVREPFRLVGDLWCATFTGERRGLVTAERYQQAVDALTKPKEFIRISAEDWFGQAVEIARQGDMECFHWELEFPEAFFDDDGRRADAGFDAVIGNPPYDVLSEAESGRNLTTLKNFISHDPTYEPSRRGKNNLYKLFVCRSLDLLSDGGYMGFITPMAVLGDDQAADIRRRIVEVGAFTGIEAFPQKDNPARRIFPEAKLSTAVFTLRKDKAETGLHEFVARVHPGRMIERNSPSLTLSTASIPLYDPANFTIVSCSQDDWDLATRIMQSGRLTRLKQFTEFFQASSVLLNCPDKPRVEREVTGTVGDVGYAGNELGVEILARSAHAERV
jgi:type I restriction-modification system DNA methylase subunit